MHADGSYTRITPLEGEAETGIQETLLAEYAGKAA